jgi:hypothetical protein
MDEAISRLSNDHSDATAHMFVGIQLLDDFEETGSIDMELIDRAKFHLEFAVNSSKCMCLNSSPCSKNTDSRLQRIIPPQSATTF